MAINMRICYLPYDHLVQLKVSNLHNYNSGNMQFLPHVYYCNSDLLVSAEDCNWQSSFSLSKTTYFFLLSFLLCDAHPLLFVFYLYLMSVYV